MEDDCKNITEMSDFIILFENVHTKIKNMLAFKKEVERLYIDCRQLDILRA